MPIKGGQVGSIKNLKKELKKRSGNFLHRVPADDPQTFRLLQEPDKWFGYFEHFLDDLKFFPCSGTPDCEGDQQGNNASQRWLAWAYWVEEDKVVPLVLPKSAVNSLTRNYDRHHTVLDRDFVITRTGTGKNDTEYHVDPEAPSRFNPKKYAKQMGDLEALLEKQLPQDVEDEEDDEPEDDAAPVRGRGAKKAAGRRRAPEPVEDEDDEDLEDDEADDEDSDEAEALREELSKHKLPKLKSIARTEYEIDPDDMQGLEKNEIVDLIVETAFSDEEDEDVDEDEDDDAEEDEDEDEDDDEGDDEGDGEEYPQYTSAELRAMDDDEVRDVARDWEIGVRSNSSTASLIKKIVAAQNDYFGTDNPDF